MKTPNGNTHPNNNINQIIKDLIGYETRMTHIPDIPPDSQMLTYLGERIRRVLIQIVNLNSGLKDPWSDHTLLENLGQICADFSEQTYRILNKMKRKSPTMIQCVRMMSIWATTLREIRRDNRFDDITEYKIS